ncbi:hypothetical protein A2U01_0075761, partial [Trifolium medium]|nr:hypothetical protein [Trifolium medium]
MGSDKVKRKVIKSVLAGIDLTISREHIAKLLMVEDKGKRIADFKHATLYRESIQQVMFKPESLSGKSRSLK